MHMLVAKPKDEASNRDALSFCMGMYVCMYVYLQIVQCNSMLVYVYLHCLRNTILCSCMYIRHAYTITQLLHNSVAKMCPRGRLRPWTTAWPVWPVSYGRTQPQAFQVPAPLITYNFSNTLKIHLNVCHMCYSLNYQIR